jgi:hypothetical protein
VKIEQRERGRKGDLKILVLMLGVMWPQAKEC